MATPSRQVRVPDQLWAEAEEACARRGTTRSAYLVGKLAELVESDRVERVFVEGLPAAQVAEVAEVAGAEAVTR